MQSLSLNIRLARDLLMSTICSRNSALEERLKGEAKLLFGGEELMVALSSQAPVYLIRL